MKLNRIARAHISPIQRIVMVQQDQTTIMIKVPDAVTDADAQNYIDYAADMARLNMARGYKDFAKSFTAEMNAMNMGFDILELPFMFA